MPEKSKRKTIQKELKNDHFRVAIFGSARTKISDKEYKDVYQLAKRLGKLGVDVVTGGGPGAMEAAMKGHDKGSNNNKKIHTIGLNIKLPREQTINKELDIKETFQTFSERLDNFVLLSNAAIVTPGGVGTLLEFMYTWQLVQVNKICHIPIILMGPMWKGLLKWFDKELVTRKYFEKQELNHLLYAENHKEASKIIKRFYEEYKANQHRICINAKKYKLV